MNKEPDNSEKVIRLPRTPRQDKLGYGQTIRKYRLMAGMEQSSIAELLNVHSHSVSNWERGFARPDLNLIVDLCRILKMPMHEFFGMEAPAELSVDEEQLVGDYRTLTQPYKKHALQSVRSIRECMEEAECGTNNLEYYRQNYISLPMPNIADAAGIGAYEEGSNEAQTVYVRMSRNAQAADEIHTVNGCSMEPDYPHGCKVFVERTTSLDYGEIGIFLVDGETYIKEYTEHGLRSLNNDYPIMRPEAYNSIVIIGRVLGIVDPKSIARGRDIDKCIEACV